MKNDALVYSRAHALTDGARVETITAAEVILLSDAEDRHARAIGRAFARDLAIRCGAIEPVAPRAQLTLFSADSTSAERVRQSNR